MKKWAPVVVAFIGLSSWAFASDTVDQGRPGSQGPWPVTVQPPGGGGDPALPVTPATCGTVTQATTNVTTIATATPIAQASGRRSVVLCVSIQNAGNPTVKCLADGNTPVLAIGNPGDALGKGDCVFYAVPDSVAPVCISSVLGGVEVTSYECGP